MKTADAQSALRHECGGSHRNCQGVTGQQEEEDVREGMPFRSLEDKFASILLAKEEAPAGEPGAGGEHDHAQGKWEGAGRGC